MQQGDTIIAVSSPPGRSARSLVRISGPGAFAAVPQPPDGSRTGRVKLPILQEELPALALWYRAPRSYTGEDTVELLLPGNPDLLQRVVDHFAEMPDLRRAEAGEFTARAFFNEKLTLSEAEGICQLISARSDAELTAADQLLRGRLGKLCEKVAEETATLLALVEAGVDFSDQEDVVAIAPGELSARVRSIHDALQEYLQRSVPLEQLSALPHVVLFGPVNAGKSSLFNALLGKRRAVVSHIAGATRDVLAEPLPLPGGSEIMLVDLAGTGEAHDPLMRKSAEARRQALQKADLLLHCQPADKPAAETDTTVAAGKPVVEIRTKCDLAPDRCCDAIAVSAITGEGTAELLQAIREKLSGSMTSLSADTLALLPRHEHLLGKAVQCLENTEELTAAQREEPALSDEELIANELRQALDALGEIIGTISPDDVLGRVFAGFCIGK